MWLVFHKVSTFLGFRVQFRALLTLHKICGIDHRDICRRSLRLQCALEVGRRLVYAPLRLIPLNLCELDKGAKDC